MTSTLPNASTPDPSNLQPSVRPGAHGRFGRFGGQYVPETLMPALAELEQAAAQAWNDPAFTAELNRLLKNYVGRATPLYEAERRLSVSRRSHGAVGRRHGCWDSGTLPPAALPAYPGRNTAQ